MHGPAQLAADLFAAGHLDDAWREVFRQVRREDFIPSRIWIREGQGYRPLVREEEPQRWLESVYSDTALVTQVEDGTARDDEDGEDGEDEPGSGGEGADSPSVPTSSSSMPCLVAGMLTALGAEEGHRVLEAGTGTGFNAALLACRLGDGNVTTVEVDPVLADAARTALERAGRAPLVVTGDAGAGHPQGAPYDRVIVTYAVHRIPRGLVQQTAPGGVLLLPWGTGLYNGVLVRLTAEAEGPRGPDGERAASGPVVGDCAFMWDRAQSPRRDLMAAVRHGDEAAQSRTGLDPRLVLGDDDAAFTAGVLVPDCRQAVGHGSAGEWTLWLADAAGGSWASLDFAPDARAYDVRQYGPRQLWDEVAAAYAWWRGAGSPPRTRFGLTTGPEGQYVWLDDPDNRVPDGRPAVV